MELILIILTVIIVSFISYQEGRDNGFLHGYKAGYDDSEDGFERGITKF